jgi:hypothetical protein
MGQTPIYQLPYPELTDPADVPTDIRELAERTETVFSGLGAGDMTRIADVNLAAAAASIDFQNIPQTFAHLLLSLNTRGVAAVNTDYTYLRMNGDTTTSYYSLMLHGTGTGVTPGIQSNQGYLGFLNAPGANAAGGPDVFGGGLVLFPAYTGAQLKSVFAITGAILSGTAADMFADQVTGLWFKTAAINRLTLSGLNGSFAARSRATLYGLRGT